MFSNESPKPLIVPTSPAETVSRLPPSPAARFIAGANAAAACCASRPARAKFKVAPAASFIPKVLFAAAFFMAVFSSSASSAVLPIVLLVRAMVLSTSAKDATAIVPMPTSGAVTYVVSPCPIFSPTSPIFCILPPTSFNVAPNGVLPDSFSSSFIRFSSAVRLLTFCENSCACVESSPYLSLILSSMVSDSEIACFWSVIFCVSASTFWRFVACALPYLSNSVAPALSCEFRSLVCAVMLLIF